MSETDLNIDLNVYNHELTLNYMVEYDWYECSPDSLVEWECPGANEFRLNSDKELSSLRDSINDCYTDEELRELIQNKLNEELNV